MDDLLKSLPSEDEAVQLALQLIELLSRGGFRLTKFMSNSRNVLAQLPPKDILGSPGISQPFDLDLDSLPVERALGVLWNVGQDTLEIKVVPKQLAPTKRGILKQTSTIIDPLGLVAPFVLRAKLILQELWRLGFDWDKPISGPLLDAWEAWKAELPLLATLSVPRCYLSNQPSAQYADAQIHIFADASEVAFGAAAYWRFETRGHSYHCSFIFGKTSLAPIKPLTIPRLELQAAVMAVRMSQTIQKELDVMPSQITYWTDSTTVLSYIKSQGTRFHTFVANQVAEIRKCLILRPGSMSLDASVLRTIVQEVFLLKTFFETAGGLTDQTFFRGVRTVGQTKLSPNLQLTMILKLKVRPGWVSVLKSTMSFWTLRRPLRGPT